MRAKTDIVKETESEDKENSLFIIDEALNISKAIYSTIAFQTVLKSAKGRQIVQQTARR